MSLGSLGKARSLGVALATLVVVACGDDGGECAEGAEGCACYPNKTCNDDLSCLSNLCVDTDGKPDDNDDNEGDGGKADGEGDGGGNDPDDTVDPDNPHSNNGDGGGGGGPDDTNDPTPVGTNNPDQTSNPDNPDDTGGGNNPPGEPPAGSPVAEHGALSVSGTHLVDKDGQSVQLKGVSSMWLNWEEDGFAEDKAGLAFMRDNWNLSVIRAAMGVETDDESPTYLTDPDHAKAQVEKIVQNAIELGVYVIIDWHDHEAIAHQTQAQAFFTEMAQKYGDVPNVLYEVFNEPLDLSWASELKPYHEALRDTIRAEDADNVIILGTPNWDQDVDVAAASPLTGDNLMYTLHFYSGTHTRALGFLDKAGVALDAGLPIFVSEWGAATADGIDTDSTAISEASAWHDWMDDNGISWAAWKFDNCSDATCFFPEATTETSGGWAEGDLNGLHAQFAVTRMKTEYTPVVVDPDPDPDPTDCAPAGTCADGNAMDCDAQGEPVEVDCDPCALLTCGTACCDRVGVFGAYITALNYDYYEAPELIADYTSSAEAVSLDAQFDTTIPSWFQQFAVHSFRLTSAKTLTDAAYAVVCLETDQIDMVNFTFENGDDGCAVTLAEVSTGCYSASAIDNCWGAWEAAGTIGSWMQLNVRMMATQYSTDFDTTLAVTSVDIP